MSGIARKLAGVTKAPAATPPTLLSSGSDTAVLLSDGFTFPISATDGYIVLAFSSRTNGFNDLATDEYSVSDSAGNTYTQVIAGTQSNGLTVSAVFYAPVTSAVTSASTTLTITTAGLSGNEAGVGFFNISAFTGTVSSQTPQSPSGTLSESVTMPSGGFVAHVIATGLNTAPTGVTSSTGYTKLLENTQPGSSTYVFYDEVGAGTTTNTVGTISSGNWSSAMAGFY